MDEWTRNQVDAIRTLVAAAEQLEIPLWLESGWAINARLNRITRLHEDVDVVYPKEREAEYVALLARLGFGGREETGCGFLIRRKALVLDTEPCDLTRGEYGFPGYPPGSCPLPKQGALDGSPVRCVSSEALYVELLGAQVEIPPEEWRVKDFQSLRLVEEHLDPRTWDVLRKEYVPALL